MTPALCGPETGLTPRRLFTRNYTETAGRGYASLVSIHLATSTFGRYSKLTGVTALLYTVVFFTAQVFLSRWCLSRFRFGPVEWVWRSLTYGALMPWRLGGEAASQGH
jgi:hypothetical protein